MKADERRETLSESENGSEPSSLASRLSPSRLEEPELSAYLKCSGRIASARAALLAAEETWGILAPVLASRYVLNDGDRIAPDGTILRSEETPGA